MTTAKMDRVSKLLEKVAREQGGAAARCNNPVHFTAALHEVLEERIGPLLRAGQAMRDAATIPATTPVEDLTDEDAHPLFKSLSAWDAAMEGQYEK